MNELLLMIIPPIVTAGVGYFIGLRKENIDLCGQRLDELEKSIGVYNTIIKDMSEKITDLKAEVAKLEVTINELMIENRKLKTPNSL